MRLKKSVPIKSSSDCFRVSIEGNRYSSLELLTGTFPLAMRYGT
jgi:hypothetical protein